MGDPLDGFRGSRLTPQQRSENEVEGVSPERYSRYVLAQSTIRFMHGIATRDDVVRVGREIVERCEARVRDCMLELVSTADLTTPKAKELHFDARVHGGMLAMLNEMIESGFSAERAMEEEDRV